MELLSNKQYCLITILQEKNYLQIHGFLTIGGRVEKNLKGLLIKSTKSLAGKVKEKILSFINESFGGSHKFKKIFSMNLAALSGSDLLTP